MYVEFYLIYLYNFNKLFSLLINLTFFDNFLNQYIQWCQNVQRNIENCPLQYPETQYDLITLFVFSNQQAKTQKQFIR